METYPWEKWAIYFEKRDTVLIFSYVVVEISRNLNPFTKKIKKNCKCLKKILENDGNITFFRAEKFENAGAQLLKQCC